MNAVSAALAVNAAANKILLQKIQSAKIRRPLDFAPMIDRCSVVLYKLLNREGTRESY